MLQTCQEDTKEQTLPWPNEGRPPGLPYSKNNFKSHLCLQKGRWRHGNWYNIGLNYTAWTPSRVYYPIGFALFCVGVFLGLLQLVLLPLYIVLGFGFVVLYPFAETFRHNECVQVYASNKPVRERCLWAFLNLTPSLQIVKTHRLQIIFVKGSSSIPGFCRLESLESVSPSIIMPVLVFIFCRDFSEVSEAIKVVEKHQRSASLSCVMFRIFASGITPDKWEHVALVIQVQLETVVDQRCVFFEGGNFRKCLFFAKTVLETIQCDGIQLSVFGKTSFVAQVKLWFLLPTNMRSCSVFQSYIHV